jgi:hypothetical protein
MNPVEIHLSDSAADKKKSGKKQKRLTFEDEIKKIPVSEVQEILEDKISEKLKAIPLESSQIQSFGLTIAEKTAQPQIPQQQGVRKVVNFPLPKRGIFNTIYVVTYVRYGDGS